MGCLESRINTLSRKRDKLVNQIRHLQFGMQMEARTYHRIEQSLYFYNNLQKQMKTNGYNYHLYAHVKEILLKLKRREEILKGRIENLQALISTAEYKLENILSELNIESL